jgi:hypothetical protein
MSDAPPLFGTPRQWAIDLALMTGVGAFLVIIGPFGSYYAGPLGARLSYWIASMWIGFGVLSVAARLSIRAATRWDLPIWFTLAAAVAVGAAPLAVLVGAAQSVAFPSSGHGRPWSPLEQYGNVLALSEPCAFGFYFLIGRKWRGAADGSVAFPSPHLPSVTGDAGGGFLDRLPPRLGRELLCLRMEDHYVRAHTARGSDLILIPLKEAMAELDGMDGLQVHRSWWVAREAVAEPLTSGRNLALRLTNGLEAPVSRASIAKLKAAGWLAPDIGR